MKKEYMEQELQEILGSKQKISPKVEQKIQETYQMLEKSKDGGSVRRKMSVWKKSAISVAACAAVLISVTMAQPTWAKELFSKAFKNLIASTEGTKYEEEDKALYRQVGKNAVSLEEKAEKGKEDEKQEENVGKVMAASAEAEGITLTASDVYSDGFWLYYTINLTTDREGMKQADWINDGMENYDPEAYPRLIINGEGADAPEGMWDNLDFRRGEDGYSAMGKIDLFTWRRFEGYSIPEEGTLDVEIRIKSLSGYLENEWEEPVIKGDEMEIEPKKVDSVKAEWNFGFTVDIDTSKNKVWDINQTNNGITLKKVTRTATAMLFELECPDFTQAPYNDKYSNPMLMVLDSNRKEIPWTGGRNEMREDGTSTRYLYGSYTEEDTIYLQVMNKNVDDSILAEFEISLAE